jgi:hypothetical protein
MTDTAPKSNREDQAMIELARTDISRPVKRSLVAAFLLIIASLIVIEFIGALGREDASIIPPGWRLGEINSSRDTGASQDGWSGLLQAVPSSGDFKDFETHVEDQSLLRMWLLPPVQAVLTSVLGLGNEEAIAGDAGWLFYAPDIEYVTAGPFLSPRRLDLNERMRQGGQPVQWMDPVPAILSFRNQLRERGIELVLLPTLVKPQIEAGMLDGSGRRRGEIIQNPSWDEFRTRLDDAGIVMLDIGASLMPGPDGPAAYLRTDTHWTPQTMMRVAREMALLLRTAVELPAAGTLVAATKPRDLRAQGDLVDMLGLDSPQDYYQPLDVSVTPVDIAGSPWTARRNAPVLLLGDSFTNIYSLESMGFGTHGGLAEHLSLALGWPIDRIARNAGGAAATREALADDLARHDAIVSRGNVPPTRERLADTKVVVWQFAMRELLSGDWRPVTLPDARPETYGHNAAMNENESLIAVSVTGRIADMTHAPDPASVPYKDAVIGVHLVDVRGIADEREIVVLGLGLQDRQKTPLDRMALDQEVSLTLIPWSSVADRYGGLNRIELDDPDFMLIDLPLYWTDGLRGDR